MIREDRPQAHSTRMEDGLPTKATQTCMSMDNFNVLSNDNIAEYGEKGEDGRECRFAIDDQEWDVVDFEPICEITDSGPSFICMGNDNDFMASIDEFLEAKFIRKSRGVVGESTYRGQLVNVTLDSTCLHQYSNNISLSLRPYLIAERRSH